MKKQKKQCLMCYKNIYCELYKKGSAKCNKCLYKMRQEYLKNYSRGIKAKESRLRWYNNKKILKQQNKLLLENEKIKNIEYMNIKRHEQEFLNQIIIYGKI